MGKPEHYKEDEYIHFLERKTGKSITVGKESGKIRQLPETEMYEIKFEDILKINLNTMGVSIPFAGMNVWNIERYMAYYWSHIMDADCIFLYQYLWDYCKKEKGIDICYPKMSELSQRLGVSKPTLVTKMKMLEENNFIVKIRRLNTLRENREDSPIYKLRATIPLLSKDQYEKLPKLVKKYHDDYMENFASDSQLEWYSNSGRETIDDIINKVGDRIVTSKARQEIKKSIASAEAEQYILEHLPLQNKETMKTAEEFQKILIDSKAFSKPSAEMFFQDTIAVYDRESLCVHMIVKDKTQKDFLEESLTPDQSNRLNECLIDLFDSVYDVRYFTREQYIVSILKGK